MMLLGILAAQRVIAAIVNLIANGDFAQAGDGWTSFIRDSSEAGAVEAADSNGRVTFNANAGQLRPPLRGSTAAGGIKRDLKSPTAAGALYRVSFDYSGAIQLGEQELARARSTIDLGGTRVRIDPLITAAAGHLTVDMTASSTSALFSIWSGAGSPTSGGTNGLNVDNITVTKL